MTTTPLDPRRPSGGRPRGITARGRVLAAAGVVLATVVAGSFALYTDSGQVEATLTAGTLDLKFDGGDDGASSPYEIEFAGGDALAPGDTVSQTLTVYNSGSVPADLALTATTVENPAPGTDKLEDALTLTITDTDAGQVLYTGALTAAEFDGLDLGAGGTPTSGGTPLQFAVAVDPGAQVSVAGQSARVVFAFTASQR